MIRKYLLTFYLSLILASPSSAQSKEDVAKCASNKGSMERLSCFDNLARNLGIDAPRVEAFLGSGKWQVQTEQSPIDDSKNVYLSLTANDSIVRRYGKNLTPTLHFRCKEKKTEGYINFDTFLGSDSTQVTTRLDKDKAKTSSWGISTDHNAAFIPQAVPFIKSLLDKEALLVQLTPYSENTIMTSFDIRGLAASVKPLSEACSWK
jgi:type VI secretion system protein VasI